MPIGKFAEIQGSPRTVARGDVVNREVPITIAVMTPGLETVAKIAVIMLIRAVLAFGQSVQQWITVIRAKFHGLPEGASKGGLLWVLLQIYLTVQ